MNNIITLSDKWIERAASQTARGVVDNGFYRNLLPFM